MFKTLLPAASISAALAVSVAAAQTSPGMPLSTFLAQMDIPFTRADTDGNWALSPMEMERASRSLNANEYRMLLLADAGQLTCGDGRLTRAEYQDLIKRTDTNGDGVISAAEVQVVNRRPTPRAVC